MLAVKGIYKQGKIELLEPIEGVHSADLFIVVVPREGKASDFEDALESVGKSDRAAAEAFEQFGLAGFFDTDEDAEVDWEEAFALNDR